LTKIADNKYYCSQKFTWLSVDIEKRLTYSCCAASPHKIDLSWLKKNQGQIFNTELLQFERKQMLGNIPVDSCEDNCWKPEKNEMTSRRMHMKSYVKTHFNIETASPTILNLNLGSTCNLTCSYCCKQYSSAWRKDIIDNGSYLNSDRFNLTVHDKIIGKMSQQEIANTDSFNLILEETLKFDQLKQLFISGGEPFLYNQLPTLLNKFNQVSQITVYTGLGVDPKRFHNQLSKIQHIENLTIVISGENCGKFYEFNRYNNSWLNFTNNIKILKEKKFKVNFNMVLSNLTVFGLEDFCNYFNEKKYHNWCNDPSFLSVNVLDDESKEQIVKQLSKNNFEFRDELIANLINPCTVQQRNDFSIYLSEFAKRRKLDLNIFPASMLKWLNLQGNHVV
jgi:organic radical activating enzyme